MVNFKYFLSSFTCSNSIVHVVHHQRNSLKPFFSYLFNLKWITQCNVQPHKNGLNQRCFFFNDIYLLLKAFALCSEFFSSTLTCTLPCSRPNRFVFPNQPHYYCLGPRSTLLCRFLTPSFHAFIPPKPCNCRSPITTSHAHRPTQNIFWLLISLEITRHQL